MENSNTAQAVTENTLGITAINFWQNAAKTVGGVTTSDASSFIMQEDDAILDLGISDPTQTKTGAMGYTIAKQALSLNTALTSSGVTVTQLDPTIQFTVNMASSKGGTKRIVFNTAVIVDNDQANNTDGSTAVATGTSWVPSTGAGRWANNYVSDNNTGKGTGKYFTFTPFIPRSGTYEVGFWYPAHAWRSTAVPVKITSTAGTVGVTVNQQTNGSQWWPLATRHFTAGTSGKVVVETQGTTGTNAYVVADAVRFRPVTLDPLVTVDVDNDNLNNTGGSSATASSGWLISTVASGAFYTTYFQDQNGGKTTPRTVTFTPNLPSSGLYAVYEWHFASTNRSAAVPVTINHAGGASTVNVDQKVSGSQWVLLGTFSFNAGTGGNVVISNLNTTGYVVADGIRFVKL